MALARSCFRFAGVAAGLLLVGCHPKQESKTAASPIPPEVPASPTVIAPTPLIDRAGLLAGIDAAAEATALGAPVPDVVTELAGRRFEVKIPFGCFGPQERDLAYGFDPDNKTLKVTVRPQAWTADPRVRPMIAGADVEAIEGFWIPRPWIRTGVCPAAGPTDMPAGEAPTVGLVEVFHKDSSRIFRRSGKPYEVNRKADGSPAGDFVLRISGRLASGDDGPPIVCRVESVERRPLCLARVELDHVTIASAYGETLGEWGN